MNDTIITPTIDNNMKRLHFWLIEMWKEAWRLQAIDDNLSKLEDGYKYDNHFITVINHYRKLIQYDLCLCITKICENGKNSLCKVTSIILAEYGVNEHNLSAYPSTQTALWKKIRAYRDKYIAHLDTEVCGDPLDNEEMFQYLQPITDYYNSLCNSIPNGSVYLITEPLLQTIHVQIALDLMFVANHCTLKEHANVISEKK